MHTYLSVLLEWANSDPRWALLVVIGFLPFGIISFPPYMKRYGDNFGNNDLEAFFSLMLSFFTTLFGIMALFNYLNIFNMNFFYLSIAIPAIYAAILYLYYFKWTDKGDKFAEEQKKKQQVKAQKKREEDEARKKKYGG